MTRRPVLSRYPFQISETATILQNARRTPGDSALFTSVELSEKAITTPRTARTPNVFALKVRVLAGWGLWTMRLETNPASGMLRRLAASARDDHVVDCRAIAAVCLGSHEGTMGRPR